MNPYFKQIFVVILMIIMCSSQANTNTDVLKVGFQIKPPFIIESNNQYIGVSMDLWKEIADSLNTKYTLIEYELTGLLGAIKNGDIDIAISPLTVTSSRIKQFGFTQPYYITNLSYATKAERDSGFITLISNIFSMGFLKSLIPLLMIISIFGLIIWALERKKNADQFGKGVVGIGEGIWWSAVTMSTVGYGDKSPVTPFGRVIGVIWMFTAVIMISGLTASISSSLTIHKLKTEISDFDDLRKSKVGSIAGSGTGDLLNRYKIKYSNFPTVEQGLIAVDDGNIDAFVYDDAVLSYFAHKDKFDGKIQVVPSSYSKEYFSFASSNYELIEHIDKILIGIIESDDWELILKKYNIEYRK